MSHEANEKWITDPRAVGVAKLTMDSRQAGPGSLFFAIRGLRTDGHKYLAQVATAGAIGAVVEEIQTDIDLPQLKVEDTSQALADAAAAFYGTGQPDIPHVAVTGTAGKTTTSTMTAAVLQGLLGPVGLVTTAGIYHPSYVETDMANTTPDAVTLHETLHQLRSLGTSALVVETSSHGIEQRRIGAIPFRYAIYTNLSHEHLDYHKTMEAYADAKARLFTDLPEDAVAIVRITDPWVTRVLAHCRARLIGYALADDLAILDQTPEGAELIARCETILTADEIEVAPDGGMHFLLHQGSQNAVRVQTRLVGHFNVENLMAAAGVAVAMGYSLEAIAPHLTAFEGVVGRQERVELGQSFAVMVDFAHTPAALETLLQTMKPLTRGRLHLVLAVAGDRDREKRPTMASIAARYSDHLVLTLQKTLNEAPRQIIADLEKGLEGANYEIEMVRPAAIRQVMLDAQPDDQVIIIGVMSRTHLDMHGQWIPYRDREVIEQAITERLIRDALSQAREEGGHDA